jgi:hypothetical protein
MPYVSDAQRKYFNENKAKLEAQGVDVNEWNKASKGKDLPEHVKKKKHEFAGDHLKNKKHGTDS